MPLDNAREAAHILTLTNRSFTGRQKTVVFVYQTGSSYSYVATQVIFRSMQMIDPQIPDKGGGKPTAQADMLMIAPLGTNFTGLVVVADTTTATAAGVAAAKKYEVIEALTLGMVPGGSHIRATLRRLR
ncbi:MAG TPA: hypothetical protein VGN34_09755 [Ktedonobacteraceae bacterium]